MKSGLTPILTSLLLTLLTVSTLSAAEFKLIYWSGFQAQNFPIQLTNSDKNRYTGGISALSGTINSLYREYNTMVISAGGDLAGTAAANITGGKSQVKLWNKLILDVYVPGSQDFNFGWETLTETLEDAKFDVLLSNVAENRDYKQLFPPHELYTVNGVEIAVTGLIRQDFTQQTIREKVAGLEVFDPLEKLGSFVETFKDSVDILIAVTHGRWETDSTLAARYKDLDIIIGTAPESMEKARIINNTVIVEGGSRGSSLGSLVVEVDTSASVILEFSNEIHKLTPDSPHRDEDLQKRAAKLDKKYTKKLNRDLARLETDWVLAETEPSNIAQWAADALHRASPSVNLSLIDNSEIKRGQRRGTLTEKDLWEIFPFETGIVVFQINGIELSSIIKLQLSFTDEFYTWSGLELNFTAGNINAFRVNRLDVNPRDEYSVITTTRVWNRLRQFLNTYHPVEIRPMFNPPGNLRELLIEDIEKRKIISTPLDRRWVVK